MDDFRHLMLKPDSERRDDMVTDLGMNLVAGGGMQALTARAVGGLCGCSRQAVQQWFGGPHHLRLTVARCFVQRWRRWVDVRTHAYGVVGLLPDCEELVDWCRIWLALTELSPRDESIADLMAMVADDERDVIAKQLGGDPRADETLIVHAVVHGLRTRLCSSDPVLSVDRAATLLHSFLLARKQEGMKVYSSGVICPT